MISYAAELRTVRAYFGLSQAMLAVWLGLSRALLASAETEREQLPRHARRWLRPWQMALLQDAHPDPERHPEPAFPPLPAGPAALVARLAECQFQAQRLWWQLDAAQPRLLHCRRQLAAGPMLLAALPAAPDADLTGGPARRRRWLQRLLEAATDHLSPAAPTGPSALVLLDARRRAFRYEADWLRTHLAGEAPNNG